ncbi:MAG: hypothetical protein DA330_05355 [Nitrososphaera sp.]|nr:hypothetical protein [Nitrososphaera sp.]
MSRVIAFTAKTSTNDELKGIKKKRLRVRGKKVDSTEDVKNWIYEIIVVAPKTPKQIQTETNFSAMHVWRYCQQLLKEGRIEKDGHIYKKKGLGDYQVRLERINQLTKQGFSQIPIIQPLIANIKRPDLKSGSAKSNYTQLRSICLGRAIPTFKCHPEDWHAHETTIAFRDEYFKYKNTDRLPAHIRKSLRTFYQLCLKYPLSEMEALQLGIDGSKDEVGKYADCKFHGNEFEDLMNYYLNKNDLEMAAYVAFATETFGRPGRVFMAKASDFHIVKEKLTRTKATWDSDWSYDERLVADRRMQMELYSALKEKIAIETFEIEVFEGKLYESKTNVTWPKEIRNPLAVSTVKKWLATRKDRIFGKDDETFAQFSSRIIAALKEGYNAVGLTHPYFYKRAMYALRHCGAHLWLVRTGYNYDAVASMGWEDINTLRLFYGRYDPTRRKQAYKMAY